jgi:predicted N-acetyltransferase YhbS
MADTSRVRSGQLELARLCRHHRVDDFVCANDTLDITLRSYHANLEDGEETVVFAAARDDDTVVGYVALADFRAVGPENEPVSTYLFLSALAVDVTSTSRWVATRLVKKATSVARVRMTQQRREYRGLLALDVGDEIGSFLVRAGFRPLAEHPPYLWWPIGSPNDR